MENTAEYIKNYGLATAVALLVFVAVVFIYRYTKKKNEGGFVNDALKSESRERGLGAARKLLERYADFKDVKILGNVTIDDTVIDLVRISYYGVTAIKVFDYAGDIYYDGKSSVVSRVADGKKERINSPFPQAEKEARVLGQFLRSEKFYNLTCDGKVFFTNKNTTPIVPSSVKYITVSNIKKFFAAAPYNEDKGVDSEAVYQLLKKYSAE